MMNDTRKEVIRLICIVLFYFCQRKYSNVVIPCLVELSINANCGVNLVSRQDVVNAVIEKGALNSRGELLTAKEVYNCVMNLADDLQELGFGDVLSNLRTNKKVGLTLRLRNILKESAEVLSNLDDPLGEESAVAKAEAEAEAEVEAEVVAKTAVGKVQRRYFPVTLIGTTVVGLIYAAYNVLVEMSFASLFAGKWF